MEKIDFTNCCYEGRGRREEAGVTKTKKFIRWEKRGEREESCRTPEGGGRRGLFRHVRIASSDREEEATKKKGERNIDMYLHYMQTARPKLDVSPPPLLLLPTPAQKARRFFRRGQEFLSF